MSLLHCVITQCKREGDCGLVTDDVSVDHCKYIIFPQLHNRRHHRDKISQILSSHIGHAERQIEFGNFVDQVAKRTAKM